MSTILEDINRAAERFAGMPAPIVGIVCNPALLCRIRRIADAEAHSTFGAVPVYARNGEPNWKAFTDHAEIRRYLSQ